ncbi:MAG TPA: MFS transporter, partial [Sphingomonadales bacterium]|nr:MFS transporter [Sphingomonadales bacterium]
MDRVRNWWSAAEVYFRSRVLAILFLGFSSGVPYGILAMTLSYWVAKINLPLADIGYLSTAGAPYAFKFLWSPIVDHVKLPLLTKVFGQRRSWLIIVQLMLIPAIIWLGNTSPIDNYAETYMAAFLISILGATQDIVIDGMRIESLEEDEQAAGAASYIYGYRIAAIICGVGAIHFHADFGANWPMVFTVGGLLIAVGFFTSLIIKEPQHVMTPEAIELDHQLESYLIRNPQIHGGTARMLSWLHMAVVSPFKEFMTRRGWYVFLLFAIFYKLGDSLAVALQTKFFLSVGFEDTVIADAGKLVGFWALLIGLGVGGLLMKRYGLWMSLLICALLQAVSNLMFSGLYLVGDSTVFLALTMGFENFATGMGATVLVAYLSLLCNRSFTITQYAL